MYISESVSLCFEVIVLSLKLRYGLFESIDFILKRIDIGVQSMLHLLDLLSGGPLIDFLFNITNSWL